MSVYALAPSQPLSVSTVVVRSSSLLVVHLPAPSESFTGFEIFLNKFDRGIFVVYWTHKLGINANVRRVCIIYCRVSFSKSGLVSWCFEPSQPQRMTSGLNTNFALSPNFSFCKTAYHMSCFLCVCFFFSLFIFLGHSTRGAAFSKVTYFILRAYTANTGKKIGKRFGKNAGEWTGRVALKRKESRRQPLWSQKSSTWATPLLLICRLKCSHSEDQYNRLT